MHNSCYLAIPDELCHLHQLMHPLPMFCTQQFIKQDSIATLTWLVHAAGQLPSLLSMQQQGSPLDISSNPATPMHR